MIYYDIHTHLDMYKDISDVVKQINEKGIFTVSSSVDVESYIKNLKIAETSNFIMPTFGVHPSCAFKYADKLAQLDLYIADSPVIGEVGLDYLWVKPVNMEAQKTVFRYIAEKAVMQDKFMIIHTKDAESDILNILTDLKAEKVVVHWYSGPEDTFKKYLCKGWYFTYGVELEFSEQIRSYAAKTPLDRLLAETDNPVGVEWLSDRTGMPYDISNVYKMITEIKEISINKLTQIIESNSKHILHG